MFHKVVWQHIQGVVGFLLTNNNNNNNNNDRLTAFDPGQPG